MLKYAAMLIIFFAFAYGGFYFASAEGRKISLCDAVVSLVRYIRQRAEYYRQPPSEIYSSFSNPAAEKSGFADHLKKSGLKSAIICYKDTLGFDEFAYSAMIGFASDIGKLPLEEQLASCDYVISLLEAYISGMKAEFPKKQKLYRSLGICIGISIVIILL